MKGKRFFVCAEVLGTFFSYLEIIYSINLATPPEVNIEVPSDSDSSRRQSVYSGRRRSSYQVMSDNSSINDFALDRKPCDDKGTPELTNVGNGQNIAVDDSVFHPIKRSNSGHIPSADTGENGKPQLNG